MGGSPSSTQRAPGDSERAAMQRSDKDVQRASTRRSGAPRSPISTRPRPSPTARVASSYSSGGGRTAALQREARGGAATAAKAPSAGAAVTAEAGAGAGVGEAGSVSRRTEADEAKQFDEAVRAQDSVKLTVRGGSMQGNKGTKWLLQDIGGSARLRSMASRFYEKAFRDAVLDKFIESHADPHGQRLGDWIAEKMGGEGNIWTDNRPPNSRSNSHRKAWHSRKRERSKVGRRFKLDDCRVWMRLMFWAGRDEGLADHKAFWTWYVQFISHFIRVYEYTAPPYAKESAEWSADPANIAAYEEAGYTMTDVIGRGVY